MGSHSYRWYGCGPVRELRFHFPHRTRRGFTVRTTSTYVAGPGLPRCSRIYTDQKKNPPALALHRRTEDATSSPSSLPGPGPTDPSVGPRGSYSADSFTCSRTCTGCYTDLAGGARRSLGHSDVSHRPFQATDLAQHVQGCSPGRDYARSLGWENARKCRSSATCR